MEDSKSRWHRASQADDKEPLVLAPAACSEAGNDREGTRGGQVYQPLHRVLPAYSDPLHQAKTGRDFEAFEDTKNSLLLSLLHWMSYLNGTGSDGGGLFGSGGGFRIVECQVHSEVLPLVAASLVLEVGSPSLVVVPTGAAASGSFGATSGGSLFGAAGSAPLDCSKPMEVPVEVEVQGASLEQVP